VQQVALKFAVEFIFATETFLFQFVDQCCFFSKVSFSATELFSHCSSKEICWIPEFSSQNTINEFQDFKLQFEIEIPVQELL